MQHVTIIVKEIAAATPPIILRELLSFILRCIVLLIIIICQFNSSQDYITKKTKPNKNKNNGPRKKEGQEGHLKHERTTFETYEIDKFIEYELKSHILPVLFGLGLVKGTSNNPRIQLVSATPYGSETIGFSTKYKTTVRIST